LSQSAHALPVSRETAIANSHDEFSRNSIHHFPRKFVIEWQALKADSYSLENEKFKVEHFLGYERECRCSFVLFLHG